MVELLQEDSNHDLYLKYLSSIEKEYNFWMSGFDSLENEWQAHRRVVKGPKGALLNRYYDDRDTPRPEAYKEDIEIAHASLRKSSEVYRDLRLCFAESGWDFSSRWLADGKHLEQIITTQIIPIDLNCLLYHIETILEQSYHTLGDVEQQEKYAIRAQKRKNAILELCWNQEKQLFFDYNFYQQTQTQVESLASAFPLFFKIATKDQASAMALSLEIKF
jgi:alpha,alpha-trehalase